MARRLEIPPEAFARYARRPQTVTDHARELAAALGLRPAMAARSITATAGRATRERSVWICSRNDAIGNLAVMLAAMGVFGTGTGWPDVIVAAIMGGLGLRGGWQIVGQARGELRGTAGVPVAAE